MTVRLPPEEIYGAIGERVRNFRIECGLTQGAFAELVGLSRPAIANIEVGRQRIYLHDLDRMAEIFGMPLAALIGEPYRKNVELSQIGRLKTENKALKKKIFDARQLLNEPVS